MKKKTWIRLHVGKVLRGKLFYELEPDERFVWFGLLLLAGDSAYPGVITATEVIGYSDEQLGNLLRVDPKLIHRTKIKLLKTHRIRIDEKDAISIINWKKYQSEYQRQQQYRHPDTTKFLEWWCKKYKEEFDEEYDVVWGRDGSIAKRLLGVFGYNKLIKLAGKFFEGNDKWIKEAGHTMGTFSSRVNVLNQVDKKSKEGWGKKL